MYTGHTFASMRSRIVEIIFCSLKLQPGGGIHQSKRYALL